MFLKSCPIKYAKIIYRFPMAGGILLILSGTAVAIKSNKKLGFAMITSGIAAFAVAGSETKIKAFLDSLNDTQNEEDVVGA